MTHQSVLLTEVLEGLQIQPTDIVVDATVGSGGHARRIADMLGTAGVLIGIDLDSDALTRTQDVLKNAQSRVHLKEGNYRALEEILDELKLEKVDKVLIDLGFRSEQLEESGRGFSFQKDEPLLMTFEKNVSESGRTAREVVNEWSEESIRDVLLGYGEERFAKQIAKKIVEARYETPIESTQQLVWIVEKAVPMWYRKKKIHPATKTFQALRTVVNDEIESLKEGLSTGIEKLSSNGRIAVITFHSIEDRIVKNIFKENVGDGVGKLVNKKPVTASEEEIKDNPRSRSAKLRIFEKYGAKRE